MKSKIMSVIRFILILIIIVCIAIIGKRLLDYRTNAQNNKAISDIVKQVEEETGVSGNPANVNLDNKDDFAKKQDHYMKIIDALKKQYNNDDIIGFLDIPGADISYPIVQGIDNDFYLRRGLNKEYDIAGSIFIDMNNSPNFNDDNTVIYGHHLEIKSMFTPLDQYRDQEFAQNHQTIYLATLNELREYKIFSAYGIPADYQYRTLYFTNQDDVVPYFNQLKSNSEVILDSPTFKDNDTIITLSTCQYDYEDQRLAVHAVRVR